MAAILLILRQIGTGLALVATAFIAGRAVLDLLVKDQDPTGNESERDSNTIDLAETAVLSLTLGLAVIAEAGLLLGLMGWLRPVPVLVAVLVTHLAGIPVWRSLALDLRGLAHRSVRLKQDDDETPKVHWSRRAWRWVAPVLIFLPFGVLTLYPPTAFDATLYHLPYARAFASSGSLPFLPDLRIPIFPQLIETLFAILLPFGGDLATHAFSLIATTLTAALLVLWGRRGSPGAGWIAAAAFLGSPLVAYLAGTAYVEPGLVLFATAAGYATDRWHHGGGSAWLTLAGLFAGAAADTKYLGLLVVGIVTLTVLITSPAGPPAPRWRRLARLAAAAGIAIAPWYGRILAATGNPLFPFLPEIFGRSPWNPLGFLAPADIHRHLGPLAVGLLRLPWDVVFARQRLGGYPPYSPVFLAALPALLIGAWHHPRVRALLLAAAAYSAVILAFLPDARYLLVALPPACLAVGECLAGPLAAWTRHRHPTSRRASAATLAALVILAPGWIYAAYRIERQGPVPVTPEQRDSYLARALPAYPAIHQLNQVCGSTSTLYALHAENLVYFAAGRFLGDWTGPAAYQVVIPAGGDPLLLYQRLRSLGVDHLLTVDGERELPISSPRFGELFHTVYAEGRVRLFALRGATCGSPSSR